MYSFRCRAFESRFAAVLTALTVFRRVSLFNNFVQEVPALEDIAEEVEFKPSRGRGVCNKTPW